MADEALLNLGFVCVESDPEDRYWVYQNADADKEVQITYNNGDWYFLPYSMSTIGYDHDVESISVTEIQAFMAKIEELRRELNV